MEEVAANPKASTLWSTAPEISFQEPSLRRRASDLNGIAFSFGALLAKYLTERSTAVHIAGTLGVVDQQLKPADQRTVRRGSRQRCEKYE